MSIARMSAAVAPTPGLLALQKAEQFDRHLGAGGAPDGNVNRAPVFARRSTPPIRVSDIIRTGRTARTRFLRRSVGGQPLDKPRIKMLMLDDLKEKIVVQRLLCKVAVDR